MPAPSRGGKSARRPSQPRPGRSSQPRTVGSKFNQVKPPVRRVVPTPASDVHVPDGVRLQKVLAQASYGSRRKAEELIETGRVEVDGQVVLELGLRVDPIKSVIHVDGMRLQADATKVTLAVNKPFGMVSAMSDPEGRPTLADLVSKREERLFHVGRLDADSEGLILMTSDGELANRLSHPKYEVPKTYLATVIGGDVYPRIIKQLLDGVTLDDGPARMDKVKVVQRLGDKTLVEVVLHEGRNRIVRRVFAAVERPVERLVRTRVGPIALAELPPGKSRVLGQTELGTLMAAVDL